MSASPRSGSIVFITDQIEPGTGGVKWRWDRGCWASQAVTLEGPPAANPPTGSPASDTATPTSGAATSPPLCSEGERLDESRAEGDSLPEVAEGEAPAYRGVGDRPD